jgi:nucleoside-diphosphate-sugar epimerase
MKYSRIFISGHRGFFGKNLIPYLKGLDDPPEIITLDRGNLCNWGDVINLWLKEKPDACINLASHTSIGASISYPHMYAGNNIDLMLNILEACKENDTRLLQVSSSEAYGTNQNKRMVFPTTDTYYTKMTEKHPLAAHSPYAWTKLVQDRAVYSWFQTYELDASIVRPFNPYGPHQPENKMIPLTIRNIMNKKPIRIFGDGSERRDWVYIKDIVKGIWSALNDLPAGEAVNFATGKNYSIVELVEEVKKVTAYRGYVDESPVEMVEQTEKRGGHVHSLLGDYSKAKKLLGWEPENNLHIGLRKTLRHLQSSV